MLASLDKVHIIGQLYFATSVKKKYQNNFYINESFFSLLL